MFKVDKHNLDKEWEKQADLVGLIAQRLAVANFKLAMLKEKEDRFEAVLDEKIRAKPEKYGIAKWSETALKAAMTRNEELKLLRVKIIKAQFRVDDLTGKLKGLSDKRAALEALGYLEARAYFAQPKIRDLSEVSPPVRSRK